MWHLYLLGLSLVGVLFFASVLWALTWAVKNGQFNNIDQGANVIFDEEEPLGIQQDFFPGEVRTIKNPDELRKTTKSAPQA